MKRYYFRKSEKELERLKRDLYYYAKVMNLDFISDQCDEGWACEIRKAKDSHRGVAFVIRHSLSQTITVEMGIISWIEQDKLISSFFPELLSDVQETSVSPLTASREKEIRHDVKVLAKVRLGSYFNHRKDVEEE